MTSFCLCTLLSALGADKLPYLALGLVSGRSWLQQTNVYGHCSRVTRKRDDKTHANAPSTQPAPRKDSNTAQDAQPFFIIIIIFYFFRDLATSGSQPFRYSPAHTRTFASVSCHTSHHFSQELNSRDQLKNNCWGNKVGSPKGWPSFLLQLKNDTFYPEQNKSKLYYLPQPNKMLFPPQPLR